MQIINENNVYMYNLSSITNMSWTISTSSNNAPTSSATNLTPTPALNPAHQDFF